MLRIQIYLVNVFLKKRRKKRLNLIGGIFGAWEVQDNADKDVSYRITTFLRTKLGTGLRTLISVTQAFLGLTSVSFRVLRNAKYQQD